MAMPRGWARGTRLVIVTSITNMLFYNESCVWVWGCTPDHERTQTNKKQVLELPQRAYFLQFLTIKVCRSSFVGALIGFPLCDTYTELIQTRSGLIDARYSCASSCTVRVEGRAELGEVGDSDCPS